MHITYRAETYEKYIILLEKNMRHDIKLFMEKMNY